MKDYDESSAINFRLKLKDKWTYIKKIKDVT